MRRTVGAEPGSCTAPADFTVPGLTCYAMIARIGDGSPFEVIDTYRRSMA